ncbi:outer membrane protein assembly factor BamB family protein [Haladaptatus sp. NG-WS-4]
MGHGSTVIATENESDGGHKRDDWWPGLRSGPARTGTTDSRGPRPYTTLDWNMDLDGSMYNIEPIVFNETVYLAVTTNSNVADSHGYLGAYDLDTGEEKWRRTDLPAPKTPAVDDDAVYFATQIFESPHPSGGFYALDVDTGETMWTHTEHESWSPPVVSDDLVFTSNRDGTYAFCCADGDPFWETDGIDGLGDDVGDALSYIDETVFVSDGRAIDADDGSILWYVSPENGTLGSPAAHDDMVYYVRTEYLVGDDDHVVVEARSANTGALEWTYESEGSNTWDGRLAITDDHVFLVDMNTEGGSVIALDAESGTKAWATPVEGAFFSSPVVGDRTMYLGGQYVPESTSSAGRALVHAIDCATGDREWSYLFDSSDLETSPEDPPAAGTPIVADGKLLTATYPAGSTLDYQYVNYSNLFVLESSGKRPNSDHRLPTDDKSDGRCGFPKPEACIEATPNLDSDDLDAGDAVRLDAFCSTGDELKYRWDTDGDGQYEEYGGSVRVAVPTSGSLVVKLQIMDANGDTDTTSVCISAN